jgi:cell division septation protein DedD
MSDTPPAAPPLGGQAVPQAASATEALYRAALGQVRLAHYLPVFARFDELGMARPHWNHAAAWLGWHWLLYRRLWRHAVWHALAVAMALGSWWWVQRTWGPWPEGVSWGMLAAIGVIAIAAPGWWGDTWLHADVRRRMTAAVRRARTVQEACALLAAPSPARRVWLAVLLLEIAALLAWGVGTTGGAETARPARPEPVVADRVNPAPPAAMPAPAPEPVATVPAGPEPTPAPASTATAPAELPPEAPPEAPPAPQARLGGHGVAVGIFADPANAERAAQRLRGAGLPVVSDGLESARGPLTRVRVGPFDTREEALAAAAAVRQLGLEARVYGPR